MAHIKYQNRRFEIQIRQNRKTGKQISNFQYYENLVTRFFFRKKYKLDQVDFRL